MSDHSGSEQLAMSGYARTAVLYFAASLVPTGILLLLRGRLGVLNTASWLVVYGVVIAMGEHAGWGIRLSLGDPFMEPHARVHFFMAGVYAAVGGVLLCVLARTLLLEGRREGWFAVLFATLVGGTIEVVMNGPTGLLFQHGLSSSQSLAAGTVLWGYLVAWLAALVIAYPPIFRRPVSTRPRARSRSETDRVAHP